MNQEFEQTATGIMNHHVAQKTVATAMFGTSFATAIAWMPNVVAVLTFCLGTMVSISIIRKNGAEKRKLDLQSDLLEARERKEMKEIKERTNNGLECRREHDKEIIEDERS